MSKLYKINRLLTLTSLCGLGLSIYAYMVEVQFENDNKYEPLCDISSRISCTKVFTSQYAKGMAGLIGKNYPLIGYLADRQNSLFGILIYSLFATLNLSNSSFINDVVLLLYIASIAMSVYLAYLLYVIQSLCIVCVATYIINIFGATLATMKKTELRIADTKNKMKKIS